MAGEQYEGEGSSMRVVCNAQVKNLKHISDMIEAVDQRQLAAGVTHLTGQHMSSWK